MVLGGGGKCRFYFYGRGDFSEISDTYQNGLGYISDAYPNPYPPVTVPPYDDSTANGVWQKSDKKSDSSVRKSDQTFFKMIEFLLQTSSLLSARFLAILLRQRGNPLKTLSALIKEIGAFPLN